MIFQVNLEKEKEAVLNYKPVQNLLFKMQLTFLTGYLKLLTFIVSHTRSKL